jgi:hypothetical protein
MAITIQKTIPSSSTWTAYSSGGDTTITLNGVESVTIHTKKDMINILIAQGKSRQSASPSDKFDVRVVDLKRGTDEVRIRGWLEDDSSLTAWEKFWKLRAMCARGGPLTNLTIDNIQWKSSTQEAFLEEITAIANADDSGALNTNKADDRARVELELSFLIGDER